MPLPLHVIIQMAYMLAENSPNHVPGYTLPADVEIQDRGTIENMKNILLLQGQDIQPIQELIASLQTSIPPPPRPQQAGRKSRRRKSRRKTRR